MENEEIHYKRAAEQLRNGEPLFGKDATLAPMLERILNAALGRWLLGWVVAGLCWVCRVFILGRLGRVPKA